MAQVNNAANNIFKNQPVTAVTSGTYTVLATDVIVDVNFAGTVAITLPAPSLVTNGGNKGKFYIIKDTSGAAATNTITISPASGTIDGAASITITVNYGVVQVFTDGANYFTQAANNAPSGAFIWNAISGTTQAAASNNGYYTQNAALTTITLPAVASTVVGKLIEVVGTGTGGWTIAQNATQFINVGNAVTTTGTGGSLSSSNAFDCVALLAVSTTEFVAKSIVGNLAIV